MSEYPECEKLKSVQPQSQIIGEFLEWLENTKKVNLCQWADGVMGEGYYGFHYNIELLLAEFFNIDLKKVEERRSIIELHRKMNAQGNKETNR
jgi:hypothetical protein